MPPKAVPIDKAKMAQREKIAADKTFGMKNKNKSKTVQKYIKSITANAAGAPKGGKEEVERKAREERFEAKQNAAIMNSLFNLATDKKGKAFDPIAKKKAKEEEEKAIQGGKKLPEAARKEIIEGIANSIRLTNAKGVRMSELGGHPIIHALKTKHADIFKTIQLLLFIKANDKIYWVDDEESNNPMVRCMEDVEQETAPDERALEDILEERRAALPPGGTPVNLETFKAWKASKDAQKQAEMDEETKDKFKRAATGKTAGMSGRDLFTFDSSLFVDDEGADDTKYEVVEDDEQDDDDGFTKGVLDDLAEEEDDEDDEDEGDDQGARGSGEDPKAGAINANLFLEGGDLPDDLDDLDDLDDDDEEGEGADEK
mmetsp:Transcript_25924/g.45964  ORF Transcript_25924/g.45964 Transcript_25924/m.45964 type:complete len:372 (+) Transcript_25924:102-1217(+)